jgi:hypothetical protein
LAFAQLDGELDLQLLLAASASAATAAAPAASAATSGDADVPGWLGDSGDGRMSGSAASASAAASGARARLSSAEKDDRPEHHARAGFLLSISDDAGTHLIKGR